ncbi:MAG: hypothetical protein KDK70_20015 [Myxococcales bacterium]|nr:hypothetical protein [Myxococcales bacterium]
MGMRTRAWVGASMLAAASGACGVGEEGDGDCPIGSLECSCTVGGACDPGLSCVDDRCIHIEITNESSTTTGPKTEPASTTSMSGSATDGSTSAGVTSADGSSSGEDDNTVKLDVGSPDLGSIPTMGCQAIDVLFAIDGSLSMAEERMALAATGSFTQVINTLEGLNGGGIDYRIGVTDDDDFGFVVPPGWAGADPWFDSQVFTAMEIATHFNGAVGVVGGLGGAALGCEHVLTSATDLLTGDMSGFVRDDALLVLVLLTDVDDFGAYDQPGGNACGIGCGTPPSVLTDLYDALVALKGGAPEGLGAIVVAGDPTINGGMNICGQPGSCGCAGFDCAIFHADRLYDFAGMLGTNGYAANLCAGPASVPTAVETALTTSIEIACSNYEPEG